MYGRNRTGIIITLAVAVFLIVAAAVVTGFGLRTGSGEQAQNADGLDVACNMDPFWDSENGKTTNVNIAVTNNGTERVEGWRLELDCGKAKVTVGGVFNCRLSASGTKLIVESNPESAVIEPGATGLNCGFQLSVTGQDEFEFKSITVVNLTAETSVETSEAVPNESGQGSTGGNAETTAADD